MASPRLLASKINRSGVWGRANLPKTEIRNPQAEGNPEPENRIGPAARTPFGFLISDFLRISVFELRI